jgi:hypothetical protein
MAIFLYVVCCSKHRALISIRLVLYLVWKDLSAYTYTCVSTHSSTSPMWIPDGFGTPTRQAHQKYKTKITCTHTHTHKTQYKIYSLNYPEKLRFYIHIASPGHLFLIDSDAPNSKTFTSQHNSLIILQLFLFVDDVCVFIAGLLYIGTTILYFCSSAIKWHLVVAAVRCLLAIVSSRRDKKESTFDDGNI